LRPPRVEKRINLMKRFKLLLAGLFVTAVGIAAPIASAHAPAHAVKTHSVRVAPLASWADSASWAD
jgi:hypothetical protein